jgi:transcriptional regulator with XRE-family HTH domain
VRVTTQEQREAFRQALIHIRQQRGWSQRRLAKEVGLSHSTIAVWERGQTIPEPANVVELERALELESGTLARLVGYMPAGTMRQEMISVLDAIMVDRDLGERERALLLTMYRQLVQQSRADRAERETSQTTAGDASNQGQDRR